MLLLCIAFAVSEDHCLLLNNTVDDDAVVVVDDSGCSEKTFCFLGLLEDGQTCRIYCRFGASFGCVCSIVAFDPSMTASFSSTATFQSRSVVQLGHLPHMALATSLTAAQSSSSALLRTRPEHSKADASLERIVLRDHHTHLPLRCWI